VTDFVTQTSKTASSHFLPRCPKLCTGVSEGHWKTTGRLLEDWKTCCHSAINRSLLPSGCLSCRPIILPTPILKM